MPHPKTRFAASLEARLRQALADIPAEGRGDIYAVSLWFYCDDDDKRYPVVVFSYNTETHCREQAAQASSPQEARWNYAFWLQDESPVCRTIGGESDQELAAWFSAWPHYYSEEESEAAFEDDDDETFETVCAKGEAFCGDIPLLIHELEYYELPKNRTLRANPPEMAGLIDKAFAWWADGSENR